MKNFSEYYEIIIYNKNWLKAAFRAEFNMIFLYNIEC